MDVGVPKDGKAPPIWIHVFAGCLARCTCETFMSPFNLVKVRQQHDAARGYMSLPATFRHVLSTEGVRGLYRGLPPRLMWAAPLSSVTFTYYEGFKKVFQDRDAGRAPSASLAFYLGGPLFVATGAAVRTPFDIVEQRLQLRGARGEPAAKGAMRATFREVYATEGVRGLMRGYPASLLAATLFLSTYFLLYESTRKFIESIPHLPGPSAYLLAGAISGAGTAVVVTPFDVLKVRSQTRAGFGPAGPGEPAFPSVPAVLRRTLREGGVPALFRGVGPRVVSYSPAGAITFWSYEMYKRTLLSMAGLDPQDDSQGTVTQVSA